MNHKAHYVSQPGFLPPHVCADINKYALETNLSQAWVGHGGGEVNKEIRNSKISWIDNRWVSDWIHPFIGEINQQVNWNFELESAEPFQYTTYSEGEYYGWHQDSHLGEVDASGLKRKLSASIILSDENEYEGGDFQIVDPLAAPHLDYDKRIITVPNIKQLGSILIFPSYLHHQVTKVTKGMRKSLVCWLSGKEFK